MPDRLDGRLRQRQVVSHLVHVAPRATEINLHVDDEQHRILCAEVAIVRPGVRISRHECWVHAPSTSMPAPEIASPNVCVERRGERMRASGPFERGVRRRRIELGNGDILNSELQSSSLTYDKSECPHLFLRAPAAGPFG